MKLLNFLQTAVKHLSPRARRIWVGAARAQIEFRDVTTEELEDFRAQLEHAARELPLLRWVEVNPHTQRVVFSFEPDAYGSEELVAVVEAAERACDLHLAAFREAQPDHPADLEPAERLLLELGADAVGFLTAATLKLSPLPASRIAGATASVLAIVRATPRLRRELDERLGVDRTDFVMSVTSGLAQGLAQRPLSIMVELAHKSALLREVQARRRLWDEREPELCQAPAQLDFARARREPRVRPLPRGPIEEYADRAWVVSLGGFGVSFLTTRSVQRAFGALFGGLPKPARLGRDVLCSELGRQLSRRGVVVTDPDALRRLDRVDCLVLQGDLVSRDRFVVSRLKTNGISAAQAREQVSRLFDVDRPVELRERTGWRLGPLPILGALIDDELRQEVEQSAKAGELMLGLARDEGVLAVVGIRIIAKTGIDELIAAAHDANMRVVVAANDDSILQGLPADDTIPEGDGMPRGIRRLQREGRTVCLVATGDSGGLPIADVGIGLTRKGEPTPWAADLICGDDLSDVRFLIEACAVARGISKQSVNIALGAASVGALVSAGGLLPMTTQRVIAVVNLASLVSMGNGVRGSVTLARKALPPPRDPTPWHALDAQGVLARLASSEHGLTLAEVANRTPPSKKTRTALFELTSAVTDELFNPLAPLLAAGAGLSAVVGSLGDAAMVGGVVGLNALIGGVQRYRTETAIKDLAKSARRRALVRRGGKLVEVDSSRLVKGDIIMLGAGDVVPADCRVIETEVLEVDASSLTGESLPVRKSAAPSYEGSVADRSSMLYEGTSIASGQATAVVVAAGDETEARRGAASAKRAPTESGVERRLRSLIDLTGPVALGAGIGLVSAGLFRGRKLEDLVGSGVSLAVASVPEGLPLLATAAQLAAAKRLSQRGALVRNARSIEALGRVDVLCVDKTGTVTQGRIALNSISDGVDEQLLADLSGPRIKVLAAALRATPSPDRSLSQADPTDTALLRAAQTLAVQPDYNCAGWQRRSELPFEAARGFHAVLGSARDGKRLSVKGAPEAILPKCTRYKRGADQAPLDEAARRGLSELADRLARRGLRVLAVAERFVGPDDVLVPERLMGLIFRGFLAFSDPVRPSAAAAVRDLKQAGVRTIMITGDHPSTAEAIATELDIMSGNLIISGAQLGRLSDDELDACIDDVAVFARVTPSQKVRVVRALQRNDHTVAMVGDGANDAPAIRLADVGIAIGEQSTSAARSAADIVLTDERIETLVHAISEGRAMWASVRDAVSILVGGNLGEIGFTLAAGLFDGRPPLSARQLLLVNLLTDVAPAMAIALRPPTRETLASLANEGPDASLAEPLNRDIAARALVTALGAGTAWGIGRFTGTRSRANTMGLLALVGTQLGQTITSGGFSRPVITTSLASAGLLAMVVQTPFLSQAFGCRPLGPVGWATALGASAFATSAGLYGPRVARAWLRERQQSRVPFAAELEALPGAQAELIRE